MSDTPETDILEEDVHVACEFVNPPEWKLIVPSSLARSLEIRLNKALKERDEASREIKELKRAAIEVLNVVPVAYCSEMYHGKRDMHSALEPCPVVERYNSKIDKLRALLKEEAK